MSGLPVGTVTFLFTDIEGSTRLWENQPEVMRTALARHDAILRDLIERQDGFVFKTVGDAFCAAFHTAADGLETALTAQRAILDEPWPEAAAIKVRMALHTGRAELRDNDYFGQPLNRVARLLSSGHGGQVLLSAATQELIRDTLPTAVSLEDMGEHRLKDLNRPERVYQLVHPGLSCAFPPLKTLGHLPNNLPWQLTSFVGRDKEMAAVIDLLPKTRLLTLTGSGGCGKTRLGLQLAADLLEQYPDGVWFVELAPLGDEDLLAQTVALTLGLIEQNRKSFLEVIIGHLKTKRLLLVLDNCEHLLAACAEFADAVLRACPSVRLLASSREGLGIAGELTYRVPSLGVPDRHHKVTLETVSHYEAVQLFIERALFHRPDFKLTAANVPALASICSRLDGIPLAIELAAARTRSLSVEEINTKLDDRFRLLTGGSKTALPRQQTLRALIDWSYGLLTSQEKALFCCLSVFSGGWTLQAATHVCGGETLEEWEVLDLMTRLVDKSLAIAEAGEESTRYRFLETVRQYARERMADVPESVGIRERHREHFLALAEEVATKLTGPEQARWLRVMDAEHDNLRQALTFSFEEPEGRDASRRLCMALSRFWLIRGHLSEGRQRWSFLLSNPKAPVPKKELPAALNWAGQLAAGQSDHSAARSQFEESLKMARMMEDEAGVAGALSGLGSVATATDEFVLARTCLEESVRIHEKIGDGRGLASALLRLGYIMPHFQQYVPTYYEQALSIYKDLGDGRGVAQVLCYIGGAQYSKQRAHRIFKECLSLFREVGDRKGTANVLRELTHAGLHTGDYASARANGEESLAISSEMGDRFGVASSLLAIGKAVFLLGDYFLARTYYEESLAVFREIGNRWEFGYCLNDLGLMALEQGDYASTRSYAEQSLAAFKDVKNRWGMSDVLDTLGRLAVELGDAVTARACFEQGLHIREEVRDWSATWRSLTGFAFLAARENQWRRSTALFAAADSKLDEVEIILPSFERAKWDREAQAAKGSLGEAAFFSACAEGRAMAVEQVVAYALLRHSQDPIFEPG
jgi:predicted ATPase/class 3 adenylate cyclase